jgi:phosphatidate phosphatase PAH1
MTARPMNLIKETRSYIYELKQGRMQLPPGAIITDTTDLTGSFRREVVDKTSHIFKTRMLCQLRDCYKLAGRDVRRFPVFLACFGNKDTDTMAYIAAGAPEVTVFLIDSSSRIQVAKEFRVRMDSYSDPRLLTICFERIELIQSGRLPDPNLPME